VALNGNNLFDKSYYNTVGTASWGNFYGEPRNFTVSLKSNFCSGESPGGRALSAPCQTLFVPLFYLVSKKVSPLSRQNPAFVPTLKNTAND